MGSCSFTYGAKSVRYKWIYKIKIRSDESVEQYKARLVAHEFSQEYGIDYGKIFVSAVNMISIRTLIAVALVGKQPLYKWTLGMPFLTVNYLR